VATTEPGPPRPLGHSGRPGPARAGAAGHGAVADRTDGPALRDVYLARARLRDVVRRTPLQASPWLSERVGTDVHLKLECRQRTGSFKLRGGYNAVAALAAATRARGLVTASAGNHGQAVALAGRMFDAPVTVFAPASAPATKRSRIADLGADLRLVDGGYDDAAAAASAFAAAGGRHYVHPFSDPAVVAGQGTVGLEILEDLPECRTVVVPVGGGGLIAGIGLVLKAADPGSRVVGVQSRLTRAMHAAFEAGRVVATPVVPTLCDGLAGEVETESYDRAVRVVDEIHLVEEDDVADAIRELYVREGVVAEGSGAVGVAALLAGPLDLDGPAAVVISGGNVDGTVLARILAGD
jgi:threonine dehydratase